MKQLFLPAIFFLLSIHSFAQDTERLILNFDFDKYNISGQAALRLDNFISKINHRSISLIKLYGHTDSKGSDDYNDALSLKRVNAIRTYLRTRGIFDSVSFIDKGFGKRQMLTAGITDQQRYLNRRVEMIVLYKNKVTDNAVLKPVRSIEAILDDTLTKKGAVVTLQNLQFEAGTTKFLSSSLPVLQQLRRALLKNQRLKISIEGHICCGSEINEKTNTEEYKFLSSRYRLSEQRARTVWYFLTQNGIAAGRLTYKGLGSTHPIYPLPEKSEEEMMANRRVEIRIIDK